jgi:hypothetical protein
MKISALMVQPTMQSLQGVSYNFIIKVKCSYPRNRPWSPIGLSDVEDPILSRQSAHS